MPKALRFYAGQGSFMDRLSAAATAAVVIAATAAVIVVITVVAAAAEEKDKDDDPPAAVVVSEHEISPRRKYFIRAAEIFVFPFFAGMLYIMKTLKRWLQKLLLNTGEMNGGLYGQKRIR